MQKQKKNEDETKKWGKRKLYKYLWVNSISLERYCVHLRLFRDDEDVSFPSIIITENASDVLFWWNGTSMTTNTECSIQKLKVAKLLTWIDVRKISPIQSVEMNKSNNHQMKDDKETETKTKDLFEMKRCGSQDYQYHFLRFPLFMRCTNLLSCNAVFCGNTLKRMHIYT